ncbi:peptidylprolyl isomerase [Domibacillus tundrae]|uniref:peptidylprolyl isomerase n=1 Tax=Domibacillus tundrae TaxID=1587527 RepID=UPI000AAB66DE|nr:peptidylprolyl isomerase [Domibacillus tundrae]
MKFLKSGRTYLWTSVIAVIAAAGFFFATADSSAETIAEVGGTKITKDELYDSLVETYGADTAASLIADKIVEKEAAKEKVKVTDEEIQEELDATIESYGGEEAYTAALESGGMTEEDMKKDIKIYLQTVKLLEPRIEITDEEISTYFDENKETFATSEQVEASHILVGDEEKVNEVAAKLAAGGDFAELAKEYSTDTTSGKNGGELGFFGTGEMAAEFETAAFAMEVGETSDPVKTDYGYHIIKVTDKQEAKEANLKDSTAEIKEALMQEKLSTEYTTWLEEKQEEYDIYNSFE